MVEFRTSAPGSNTGEGKSSGGFSIDGIVEKVINDIQSDPQKQAQVATILHEQYDIPPQLLGTVFGDLEEVAQEQMEEQPQPVEEPPQLQEAKAENQTQTQEVKKVTEKPSVNQLEEFVDEIIDYTGEDYTLGELREWIDENPDIVETAIMMKF